MFKNLNLRQVLCLWTAFAFLGNSLGIPAVYAQEFVLPKPGVMVHLSSAFNPPVLKGIKVHPDNPFRFDFILDKGDSPLADQALKDESTKLIKYFLASLTIPEKDLWVNLSPYEKDRIVPESFGQTEMGRDLLAQDYMLKQITASLIYPEDEIGKKFWKRVYEEAQKKYGTTQVPVNTFNKVWIVPEKAVVYENAKAGTAYVVESKLKVMLEQDYLALGKSTAIDHKTANQSSSEVSAMGSQIVREIVIPELTKEVNEGKNFIQLRQTYNSLVLAVWYKKKIKDSVLKQVYEDKNKIAGVNSDNPMEKQKIYQEYLQAFKKGVYNYIKEDYDFATQKSVPRKYFSGGVTFFDSAMVAFTSRLPQGVENNRNKIMLTVNLYGVRPQRTQLSLFTPIQLNRASVAQVSSNEEIDFAMNSSEPREVPEQYREQIENIKKRIGEKKQEFMRNLSAEELLDSKRVLSRFDWVVDVAERLAQNYPNQFDVYFNSVLPKLFSFSAKNINFILTVKIRGRLSVLSTAIQGKGREIVIGFDLEGIKKSLDEFKVSLIKSNFPLFFYLSGSPVLVSSDNTSSEMYRRLVEAANFISQSGWYRIFPNSLHATESVVLRKGADIGGLSGPSGITTIGIETLLEYPTSFVAAAFIHEDQHHINRDNPRRQKIEKFEKTEGYSLVKHRWLAHYQDAPSNLMDELSGYYAGEKFYYHAYSHRGITLNDMPMIEYTLKETRYAKEAIEILESLEGELSEEGLAWFRELENDWLELTGNIQTLWENALDILLASTDADARYNGYYYLAQSVEIVPEKEVLYLKKFLNRLKTELDLDIVRGLSNMDIPKDFTNGVKQRLSEIDSAMLGDKLDNSMKGGIDFNYDKINFQVQNDGEAIKFHMDPTMLKQLQNTVGFTPVIINIQPMNNLHEFLGVAP